MLSNCHISVHSLVILSQLLLFLWAIAIPQQAMAKPAVAPEMVEGKADVQLITKRTKRSLNANVGENIDRHEFHVKVSAFGITHNLTLVQPKNSVISSAFRMQRTTLNETGNVVWMDVTPSKEEIEAIEQRLFVDVSTNTAVKLDHDEDGNGGVSINGLVNDAKIRKKRETGEHVVNLPSPTIVHQNPPDVTLKDYIIIPQTLKPRAGVTPDQLKPAVVELVYVVDFANTVNTFNNDVTKMIEYYAIMTNSINNKFALSEDLHVTFKMNGILTTANEAGQPYVRDGFVGSGKYNLETILNSFETWAYKNKDKIGTHDIAPLMLGVEFHQDGLRGLSPVGGACQLRGNKNLAIPCSQDIGGIFGGAFTVAHEIAHDLGAYHDGEQGYSADCPWSDGYIMSYLGWGKTVHWKLSKCSIRSIKEYISSTLAECLFKIEGTKDHTSKLQIGDQITQQKMCEHFDKTKAYTAINQAPQHTCRNTVCKSDTSVAVINNPPGNNHACGNGGKCINGYCMGDTSKSLNLDELCQMLTGNPSATFHEASMKQNNLTTCGRITFCFVKEQVPGGTIQRTLPFSTAPDAGTHCGQGKICNNEACVEDVDDTLFKCIKNTHQDEWDITSSYAFNGRIFCAFGNWTQGFDENANRKCADGQIRFEKSCIKDFTTKKRKYTVRQMCQDILSAPGNDKVRPVVATNRDEYCAKLKCQVDGKQLFEATEITPDGVSCGPIRVCKGGKCVPCVS